MGKEIKNSENKCGRCGSDDLEYIDSELEDGWERLYVECNVCKQKAKEWRELVYRSTELDDYEEDELFEDFNKERRRQEGVK
jgi:hypothetical protein